MTLQQHALAVALHERAIYRTMALAALDQLAEALREVEMLRDKRERVTRAELDAERGGCAS